MLDDYSFLFHNIIYWITSDAAFNDSIQTIQQMPDFLSEKVQWGLDASYKTLGFMAVLVLGVSMFKR